MTETVPTRAPLTPSIYPICLVRNTNCKCSGGKNDPTIIVIHMFRSSRRPVKYETGPLGCRGFRSSGYRYAHYFHQLPSVCSELDTCHYGKDYMQDYLQEQLNKYVQYVDVETAESDTEPYRSGYTSNLGMPGTVSWLLNDQYSVRRLVDDGYLPEDEHDDILRDLGDHAGQFHVVRFNCDVGQIIDKHAAPLYIDNIEMDEQSVPFCMLEKDEDKRDGGISVPHIVFSYGKFIRHSRLSERSEAQLNDALKKYAKEELRLLDEEIGDDPASAVAGVPDHVLPERTFQQFFLDQFSVNSRIRLLLTMIPSLRVHSRK